MLGGFGTDTIVTGLGEDLILGDNGKLTFTITAGATRLTRAETTDDADVAVTGDLDVILTGGGTTRNVVLAGLGADRVNAPARPGTTDPTGAASIGDDIVIGDNGFVTWDSAGQITQFASTQPAQGGDDLIDVGDGANIVVGGFGGDTITAGINADIIVGDNGEVSYTAGTTQLLQVKTTDLVNRPEATTRSRPVQATT